MRKTCYSITIFLMILIFASCSCKHENTEKATCANPMKCNDCGINIGEPTDEHMWEAATCAVPKTCKVCGKSEGNVTDEHEWEEATCYSPKTCLVCKKTDGEKIPEHTWLPATCTLPQRCETCDDTVGEELGHTWVEATYDSPKTCSVCKSTEGNALVKPPFLAIIKNNIPMTINNYFSSGKLWNSVLITDVIVSYEKSYSGDNNIILYFSGEKKYDYSGTGISKSCSVGIKVYDEEGYVVADETYYTHDLQVGDKFKDDECKIYENLPDGEYTIELLSTT